MKILVLDDMEERHRKFHKKFFGHTVHEAWSMDEYIEKVSENTYDAIFLDCDLSDGHYGADPSIQEKNGVKVTQWITTNRNNPTAHYIIHSLNTVGTEIMKSNLLFAGYKVDRVSYNNLDKITI